ncbi:hypothetical protein HA050_17905 [Iodobacter sp. HSC-16F04]|uniref:Uncharacterized protein n=1 Tax=Iodobacter violaceini TaxID=3044271 RepID=A0ABX0KZF3_9NEIS|nr:hypothetical protein [Iodobacter violacea]NHQ87988.1 hypothetical protein [Iodobacter violacea]
MEQQLAVGLLVGLRDKAANPTYKSYVTNSYLLSYWFLMQEEICMVKSV